MCALPLRSYFQDENEQRLALESLGDWFDPKELDLYDASRCAFDPSSSANSALAHFSRIYHELASPRWQVFRPSSPAACWPPQQVFNTITLEFPEFSWWGSINLLNFSRMVTAQRLDSCLAKMRGIKPKQEYPHMTVSKFLHFYNPGLFPIYDTKVIWEQVFKRFDSDFRRFCPTVGIQYARAVQDGTEKFLRYYMLWANSLMSVAHPTFMQVFTEWLGKQAGTMLARRSFDPATLYARAFEYTATGAAMAS